jgi:hypothetical protein
MSYRFEEQQFLKFEVYDFDSSSSNLVDHDFLGVAACNLGQIISSGKVGDSVTEPDMWDVADKLVFLWIIC